MKSFTLFSDLWKLNLHWQITYVNFKKKTKNILRYLTNNNYYSCMCSVHVPKPLTGAEHNSGFLGIY